MPYKLRYEGIRWKILYGQYQGVEQFALEELQRTLQKYLPYVLRVEKADASTGKEQDHLVILGTVATNPCLAELVSLGRIQNPERPQGYTLACFESPWGRGNKVIAIAGTDPAGVLYGVEEFNAHFLDGNLVVDHPGRLREALDSIGAFRASDFPLVENRGIWTWGYVVYDYRRFLDNMARLKMNCLTLWNDCPPLNAPQLIEYAHSRGIQIVMGFHWGWGIEGLNPSSPEDLEKTVAEVRANYRQNYHPLAIDGIYFQTFTETYDTRMQNRSIASLACQWVNRIAASLYEINPALSIQFGLHATSIVENYPELKSLDPRITIAWEDAGAVPYSYEPVTDLRPLGFKKPEELLTWESTVDYSRRLVNFRENREFAMVPKGFTALRWDTEFEHHGPFLLGERDQDWIAKRLRERRARWDRIHSLWLRNYPYAARFYREILNCSPSKVTLTALVEDGLFEEKIEPAVALFAETAWNPRQEESEMLRRALCPYYST